jgi:hypothetical protein
MIKTVTKPVIPTIKKEKAKIPYKSHEYAKTFGMVQIRPATAIHTIIRRIVIRGSHTFNDSKDQGVIDHNVMT